MRKFILNRKTFYLVAIAVAGGFLFSFFVGSQLVAAKQCRVDLPEMFAGSEVTIKSESGETLRGNLLRGKEGQGVVILMHGIRTHRGSMARHAEFLQKAGYSVLLFDFQAHGESSGTKITSGYLESKDARSAVEFVKEQLPGEKIAVIGSSLGGAATVLAEPPLEIDAAVLEMVYADLDRAVKNRIVMKLGDWARPFSCLLTMQLQPRLGVGAEWFSPMQKIRNLRCPKLVVAGAKDRHTTLEDTNELFANAGEPKELWVIENAAHQDLHYLAGAEYEKRILGFLERHLGKVEGAPSRR